jgi:primosomal protein N'
VPDHPVLQALTKGDPAPVLAAEEAVRRRSGLPPFSALALISGALAVDYAQAVTTAAAGSEVSVAEVGDRTHLVRAPDHHVLCDFLSGIHRPPGRGLRVEVDPRSL